LDEATTALARSRWQYAIRCILNRNAQGNHYWIFEHISEWWPHQEAVNDCQKSATGVKYIDAYVNVCKGTGSKVTLAALDSRVERIVISKQHREGRLKQFNLSVSPFFSISSSRSNAWLTH
jgi:hypothetical protein